MKKVRVLQWHGDQVEDVPPEEIPSDWRRDQIKTGMTKKEKAERTQNALLLFTMSSVGLVFSLLGLAVFGVILYAILAAIF